MISMFVNFVSSVRCALINWRIVSIWLWTINFFVVSVVIRLNLITIVTCAWRKKREAVQWNGFNVEILSARNGFIKFVIQNLFLLLNVQLRQILIYVLFVDWFKKGKYIFKSLIAWLFLMRLNFSRTQLIKLFPSMMLWFLSQCAFL